MVAQIEGGTYAERFLSFKVFSSVHSLSGSITL
jgi:hypothetical protein